MGSTEIDISQVTPRFLQDTFELKYQPTYLKVESGIRVVQISPSTVRPNEHYIIEGPLGSGPKAMSRNRKKKSQGDRTGIYLLRSISQVIYAYVLAYLNFIFEFQSSFSTAQNGPL